MINTLHHYQLQYDDTNQHRHHRERVEKINDLGKALSLQYLLVRLVPLPCALVNNKIGATGTTRTFSIFYFLQQRKLCITASTTMS